MAGPLTREIEDFLHFLEKDGDDSLIPQKMDEAGSRLDVMLKVPGFREYMESHGYRTEFGNGRYVMTPAFYNNVYKGALGEIFCEFFSKSLAIRFTESKTPPSSSSLALSSMTVSLLTRRTGARIQPFFLSLLLPICS